MWNEGGIVIANQKTTSNMGKVHCATAVIGPSVIHGSLMEGIWLGRNPLLDLLNSDWTFSEGNILENLQSVLRHQPIRRRHDFNVHRFNVSVLYINTTLLKISQQAQIWHPQWDSSELKDIKCGMLINGNVTISGE